jgi:ornithine decarboxylase
MTENVTLSRSFEITNLVAPDAIRSNLSQGKSIFFSEGQLSPTDTNYSDFIKCNSKDAFEDQGDTTSLSDYTDTQSSSSSSPSPEPFELGHENHENYHLDAKLTALVGREVVNAKEFCSMASFVNSRIENGLENASFLVTNLTAIVNQFHQWKRELPMVEPFYAVKCNPDPVIVRLLASLGCNFDCATMGEIDLVLNGLGDHSFKKSNKASDSIVYANPAKMENMLKFALQNDVSLTVFDGEDELYKLAAVEAAEGSKFNLLLRLTTDDRASVCRFSKKFGCPVEDALNLLPIAQKLNLNIVGVSFHVGSGCGDAAAYATALDHARRVFEEGTRLGMPPMTIVDLGGGFPGDTSGYGGEGMPTFQELAAVIRESIDTFNAIIPQEIRYIAEPGRYFVSASTAITTKVYSRKGGNNAYQALYVDDGVYGSFNNVVYDHAHPRPQRLRAYENETIEEIPSAVFGPTCDGLDQMCTLEDTVLPRCEVGDWLIWENQGAYTHTASFVFNGYTHIPGKSYCVM